jgi:quinol monooxygenase YgiN
VFSFADGEAYRYKDQDTLKAHGQTEYFKALGKAMAEEGLVSKPLNIMILQPFSGFEGR